MKKAKLRAARLTGHLENGGRGPVAKESVGESPSRRSPMAARTEAKSNSNSNSKPEFFDYDYSSFYYSSSDDVFAVLNPYTQWYDEAQLRGYYLYAQPMSTPPNTR